MKKFVMDLALLSFVGAGTVYIMVLLLGELIGAPLELSLGEWALALGAGAALPLPGYILGLFHYRQWRGRK